METEGSTVRENSTLAVAPIAPLALWDANALHRQVGNNDAFERRLLAKFLQKGKTQVADLVAAATAWRPANVAEIAHSLKASARSVGAMQLGESCQRTEQAGFAGHAADLESLVSIIEADFVCVAQVIEQRLA